MVKKLSKILGISFAVLVVVAAIASYLVYARLDIIAKAAIEKYGTEATKTSVTVSGVKLSPTSGEGAVNGLRVGTPDGFTSPFTLDLNGISMKMDVSSIRGTGPIVIKEIIVDKPQVSYEILNDGKSNMQTISKNAQSYKVSSQKVDAQNAKAADKGEARKFIIKSLLIRDGQITINQPMLKHPITSTLPSIRMSDIGTATNGATPAQIAQQLLAALTSQAAIVASNDLAKQFGTQLNNINSSAQGEVKEVKTRLKSMFRKHQ